MSRRRVLRGVLAGVPVTLGLPRLEAMLNGHGEAYADGTPLPTRFGVWFFGTGVYENWMPAQTGPLVLPNGFTALERHKARVTMVSGLKFESFGDYATNRHYMGGSSVLSGTRPNGERPGGVTIDQLVARAWNGTPRASLEVSVTDSDAISYNAVNSPNPPVRDPRVLMARLFGGAMPAPDTSLAKKTYLDAVLADVASLQKTLGTRDRERLESYLDGVNELQKDVMAARPAACVPEPTALTGVDDDALKKKEGWTAIARAQSKLVALALGCGITRVFTFNMSAPNSSPWFPNGVANTHHELGHQQHADLPKSVGYIMERFAETLDALAAWTEGAGNLLDRTGIIVLTEVSWNHHDTHLPVILAGGAGGKLKGGLHVRSSGASTRASYTLARAVGANVASFGSEWAKADEGKVIGDVLI